MVLSLSNLLSFALTGAALLLAVPVVVFSCQVFVASIVSPRRKPSIAGSSSAPQRTTQVVVLVPAHNESKNLRPTLTALKREMLPADRIIVIADNCSDDTATHARDMGVEVLERTNKTLRGKGYALAHGWEHLVQSGRVPEHVLVVDADCIVHARSVEALVKTALATRRPVQALYLCQNAGATSVKQRISEFAWAIKNWARPLGYSRMGLPCQLAGSGMLFTRECLQQHSFASGHLVEDLQMGLALAADDQPPIFCPAALVTSDFPVDPAAQQSQRTRWEHGHLAMIGQALPGLLTQCLKRPRVHLLALALDLAVPAFTLLMLAQFVLFGICAALLWATGASTAFAIVASTLTVLCLALMTGWYRFGREIVGLSDILTGFGYVLAKFPIYVKFVFARQTEWIRTKRDSK